LPGLLRHVELVGLYRAFKASKHRNALVKNYDIDFLKLREKLLIFADRIHINFRGSDSHCEAVLVGWGRLLGKVNISEALCHPLRISRCFDRCFAQIHG